MKNSLFKVNIDKIENFKIDCNLELKLRKSTDCQNSLQTINFVK